MSNDTDVLSEVITLSDKNFEESVIRSKTPALVDFWADWCQPCRMVSPVVEEIARDYGDQILVGKLNVDTNPVTTGKYGIRAIPALLLFKDGKLVRQITGVRTKMEIQQVIDQYL